MTEESKDWSTAQMTPRARQHYEKRFLPDYIDYVGKVKEQPLTLLVWGPGELSGGAYEKSMYQKRVQIKGMLLERGFAAVFSEDVEADYPVTGLSSKAKEILQALSADLVVVLQSSFGSTAEVHDVAEFIRDIGPKMMIFVNQNITGGYSYSGALRELDTLYRNVHPFDYPKDVEECHLATKVIERAEVMRHAKWRMMNLK